MRLRLITLLSIFCVSGGLRAASNPIVDHANLARARTCFIIAGGAMSGIAGATGGVVTENGIVFAIGVGTLHGIECLV